MAKEEAAVEAELGAVEADVENVSDVSSEGSVSSTDTLSADSNSSSTETDTCAETDTDTSSAEPPSDPGVKSIKASV